MTIYVYINFFIKVDQLIIVPQKQIATQIWRNQWVKQALYKQNETENNTVLWN